MQNDREGFGRRLKTARAWAGYKSQEAFGEALMRVWPDWEVKTNVKRIELGLRTVGYEEMLLWSDRIHEFTAQELGSEQAVPKWFMLRGWAGGQEAGVGHDQLLEELRESVAEHDRLLLQIIRDRPAPTLSVVGDDGDTDGDLASSVERAAEQAAQPEPQRSERSAPKKRAPRR
jgi:hypothetical protein